jgi:fatty acid desaturase
MSGAAHESRDLRGTMFRSRLAAIRVLEQVEARRHLPILVFPAIWLLAGLVAVNATSWWWRVPAMIVIGMVIHGLGIVMHEAIHGNLFRRQTPDRWAAVVAGIPALVSGTAYRVTHLAHHRYNRGERDPDEFAHIFRGRRLQSVAFWVWAVFGLPIFIVHVAVTAMRRGSWHNRRAVLLEYAILLLVHAAIWVPVVRAGHLDIMVRAWALPLIATSAIVSLRGWSEHMLTRPEHPLTRTRTITSNRVTSFLMLNLNYHLEHHLFPGIPWYNLPRLHHLLQDEYGAAGTPIYRSYVRFAWDAARQGFHGLAPDPSRRNR